MKNLLSLFTCLFIVLNTSAQYSAEMVADYSPGRDSTVQNSITSIGGRLYFSKRHSDHEDPYVFDGGGITQIAELSSGAIIRGFTAYKGKAYFLVVRSSGSGLWESDGTMAGTKNVVNIMMEDDRPFNTYKILVYDNKLYFPQYSKPQYTTSTLWQSDGTTAHTTKLKDIIVNDITDFKTYFFDLTVVGGKMRFRTMSNYPEDRIWVSNGTTTGTYEVTLDFQDANFQYNGKGYFCPTPDANTALWATDGTLAGTYKVKDLYAVQAARGCVDNFHILKDKLFFTVRDTDGRLQLWISDGSEAGTNLITLTSGKYQIGAYLFKQLGDTLLFSFIDGTSLQPLYYLCATDGTEAGTYIVSRDFPIGLTSFNWDYYMSYIHKGKLYFPYISTYNLKSLFYSDGTAVGTGKVELANENMHVVGNFDTLNGELYYVANYGGFGSELWKLNEYSLGVQTTEAEGIGQFIYPNPATNSFSVQTKDAAHTSVSVYSLAGQLLLQTKQTANINVQALPAGTYSVQVQCNGIVQYSKLIKG